MTTIGPIVPEPAPTPQQPTRVAGSRRPVDVASYLVGVAGLASAVSVLFLTVRAVLQDGGARGTGVAVAYVIFGGLLFAVLAVRGAFRLRAPGVVLLSGPVALLAVALAFFLQGGGWIVTGLLFAVLGLVPLVAMVWVRRAVGDAQRNLLTMLQRRSPGGRGGGTVIDGQVVDGEPPPS